MTLEELSAKLRTRLSADHSFGHAVLLDFGTDGRLRVDARTAGVPVIAQEAGPADCSLHMSLEDFVALAQKKLNPQMAYMTGRLRVEGDLMVAMPLAALLS